MGVLIRGRPSPDIYDEGALIATRPRIDFVGAGVAVTDDPTNGGLTVTVARWLAQLAEEMRDQVQRRGQKELGAAIADERTRLIDMVKAGAVDTPAGPGVG